MAAKKDQPHHSNHTYFGLLLLANSMEIRTLRILFQFGRLQSRKNTYLCTVVSTEAGAPSIATGLAGGATGHSKRRVTAFICGISNLASSMGIAITQCTTSIDLHRRDAACRVRHIRLHAWASALLILYQRAMREPEMRDKQVYLTRASFFMPMATEELLTIKTINV